MLFPDQMKEIFNLLADLRSFAISCVLLSFASNCIAQALPSYSASGRLTQFNATTSDGPSASSASANDSDGSRSFSAFAGGTIAFAAAYAFPSGIARPDCGASLTPTITVPNPSALAPLAGASGKLMVSLPVIVQCFYETPKILGNFNQAGADVSVSINGMSRDAGITHSGSGDGY